MDEAYGYYEEFSGEKKLNTNLQPIKKAAFRRPSFSKKLDDCLLFHSRLDWLH
jgi:hypothetical protein